MKKAFISGNEKEEQEMQRESKSLFVMMCVIGIGILLIMGTIALAAEKLEGKVYVNAKPAFSIIVPSWGEDEKEAIDYVALGQGMFKVPKFYVMNADYYTDKSNAESLTKAMIGLLKDRYGAKDLRITYTKEIKLADGTPVFEAGLEWQHPHAILYSSCIWAKKGNTKIAVIISDMGNVTESLKAYMYSLSIK